MIFFIFFSERRELWSKLWTVNKGLVVNFLQIAKSPVLEIYSCADWDRKNATCRSTFRKKFFFFSPKVIAVKGIIFLKNQLWFGFHRLTEVNKCVQNFTTMKFEVIAKRELWCENYKNWQDWKMLGITWLHCDTQKM